MANFKTHITISTAVGVGVGAAGHSAGMPLVSCMLGGGICSVAGILPDLDSDSGIPFRESVAFVSAFVPLMMVQRFEHLGWSREVIVLACALIYIGIRFGVAEVFRRYTVHRGMWHSIPAAFSVALLTFLIADDQNLPLRLYWGAAALAGFLTHLLLDEIYSVDFRGIRIKKSFGTALKMFSRRGAWPNVSTYGKLIFLAFLAWTDPMLMDDAGQHQPGVTQTARQLREHVDRAQTETADQLLRR